MAALLLCATCGTALPGSVRICPSCGSDPSVAPAGAVTNAAAGTSGVSVSAATVVFSPPVPSGFWRRVAAFVVDAIIFSVPSWAIAQVLPVFGNIVAWWLYFALFESSTWQATPGKRLIGIRVTDVNGVKLQFGRATGRFFARFASALPMGLGFVMAAFTKNRQALHDFIASTRVLSR